MTPGRFEKWSVYQALKCRIPSSLRRRIKDVVGSLFASDLTRLAHLYHTDKSGHHEYTRHYQRHFESLRNFNLNILEIGVGGFESATAGGNSLRMWKKYFPKGKIYGIDIYDKSGIDEDRIKTFCGSQADSEFLRRIVEEIGEVDIIVDDGSHQNQHDRFL